MEKNSNTPLNFKPLSKGLGFHPYENGLPYSPTKSAPAPAPAPAPRTSGTGAVAAGSPTFVFPKTTAKIVPATLPEVPKLGWNYLTKRVLAFSIDSFVNMSLAFGVLITSLWQEDVSLGFFFNPSVFLITAGFLLFFSWALTTAQEVAFGTSIGKKICGLSMEGSALATVVRALFFIPSFLCLGLGVLWAGVDSNRRGFHDLISGIQPEEA